MSNSPNEPSGPRRRRSGCWWIVLAGVGVVAILGILVCGGLFLSEQQAGREVERELARLRAAGEPTTLEELDAFYAVPPPDQDVTALVLEAISLWPASAAADERVFAMTRDSDSIPLPGRPWPDRPAAERYLARHAASLEKLHLAARRDGLVRFPGRFQDGVNFQDPDYQTLIRMQPLLTLEAYVRAHRGDAHGAAASIETMLATARSLRQDPLMTVQVLRVGLDASGGSAVERLLGEASFSDEDLARLQARLQQIDYDEGLLRAVMAVRAMGCAFAREPAAMLQTPVSKGAGALGCVQEGTRLYLEWMKRTIEAMRLPLPERLDRLALLEAEIEDFRARAGTITQARYALAIVMSVSVRPLVAKAARGTAHARLAAAAIAAHRFRLKHGKVPANLKELVPEFLTALPTDPFDGKPLRYVVRDKEILVYSIGLNRVDDGGVLGEPAGEDGDLVFSLRRR